MADFRALATTIIDQQCRPADFVGLNRAQTAARLRAGTGAHANLIANLFQAIDLDATVANPEIMHAYRATNNNNQQQPIVIKPQMLLTSFYVRAGMERQLPNQQCIDTATAFVAEYDLLIAALADGTDPHDLPTAQAFSVAMVRFLTEMRNTYFRSPRTLLAFHIQTLRRLLNHRAIVLADPMMLGRINNLITFTSDLILASVPTQQPEEELVDEEQRITYILDNADALLASVAD